MTHVNVLLDVGIIFEPRLDLGYAEGLNDVSDVSDRRTRRGGKSYLSEIGCEFRNMWCMGTTELCIDLQRNLQGID